ncbi:MAG TPA: DUF2505 family protein [Myxococcota bacterium]|nr:DUF2505 family protein [Myxococcota bacterium]
MKFEQRDTFAVAPDVLFASLIDPEIDARLARMAQAEREPIDEVADGDVIVRRVRYSSGNPAFAGVARLLGTDRVTYEQHLRIDAAKRTVDWKMVHPAVADRMKAEGRFWVVEHAEGSERIVEGTIEVRIPLMASMLEGKVVDFLRKMYARGTQWRREYLARGPS